MLDSHGQMTTLEDIFRAHISAYSSSDIEGLLKLFSPDCIVQDMADPENPIVGHDKIREFLKGYFADLSEKRVRIESITVGEADVIGEIEVTADWVGSPFSLENPRRVKFSYAVADKIKDGQIVRERYYWDADLLRKQLQ